MGDATSTRINGEDAAPAPTGDLGIVFTDIKESTAIWETSPEPMIKALDIHDKIIRRLMRVHGGYEVKTIGDAFMIACSTAASALLLCAAIQRELSNAQWPSEILESTHGKEIRDTEGNVVFRGLSVRMGIHWGRPICKDNEVTGRTDYIGPMVHRAARIIEVAMAGQIVVTGEFIEEARRALIEARERVDEAKDEDTASSAALLASSQRDFEIRDLGEQEFKGLSNPLHLYLIIPGSLRGRLDAYPHQASSFSSLWNWLTG